MATCKDCIHERVCVIKAFPDAFENTQWKKNPCDHFEPKTEWIPASEPPKENGIYCVMVENHKSSKYKQRTHARYKNGRWLDLYDNWENRCWHVTHWMPLPEPPKGVAE